jgi:hypothetical protein
MGWGSKRGDDLERRIENGAGVLDEYQPSFTQGDWRTSQGVTLGLPAELIAAGELISLLNKECAERLSREMTLVYTLNEQRTRVLAHRSLSKGEAVEMTQAVMGGELLDLDCGYRGMLLRERYIFVSERTAVEGLRKHGPEPVALLNGMLAERLAA